MCFDESLQLRRVRFLCVDSWPALSPWLQCTSSMLMVCLCICDCPLDILQISYILCSPFLRHHGYCSLPLLSAALATIYSLMFCASWLQQTIARAARWCSTCNVLDCITAFHGKGSADTEQQADATQKQALQGPWQAQAGCCL